MSRVVRSRTAPSIFDRPAKCDSTIRERYQKILDAASGIPHHLTARRSRTAARLQCGCTGRAFGNAKRNPFIEVTPEARARVWSATRKLASCLLDETRRLRERVFVRKPHFTATTGIVGAKRASLSTRLLSVRDHPCSCTGSLLRSAEDKPPRLVRPVEAMQ